MNLPTSCRAAALLPILAVALIVTTHARAGSAVVPAIYEDTPGNINLVVFNLGSSLLNEMRYMQVFDASEFAGSPVVLHGMMFRTEEGFGTGGQSFSNVTLPNMLINLSTTARAVDGLSSVFKDNYGDDATNVLNGSVTLSGSHSASFDTPSPFDIYVPFSRPFLYDPSQGNLLMEVANPNGSIATASFDASSTFGDNTSSIFAPTTDATSATFNNSNGLVTQFLFNQYDPSLGKVAPQSKAFVHIQKTPAGPEEINDFIYPYVATAEYERHPLPDDQHVPYYYRNRATAGVNPIGGAGPDNPFGGGSIGVEARIDVPTFNYTSTDQHSQRALANFTSVFTPVSPHTTPGLVDIDLRFVLDGSMQVFNLSTEPNGDFINNAAEVLIVAKVESETADQIELLNLGIAWNGYEFMIFEETGDITADLINYFLTIDPILDDDDNRIGGTLTVNGNIEDLPINSPLRQRFENVVHVEPGDWVALTFEMTATVHAADAGVSVVSDFFHTLNGNPTSDTEGVTFEAVPEPASAALLAGGSMMLMRRGRPTMAA